MTVIETIHNVTAISAVHEVNFMDMRRAALAARVKANSAVV